MSRCLIAMLSIPMIFSALVHAEGSADASTEFMHQAASGKIEVTPGFVFGQSKINYSSTYSSDNQTSSTDNYFNFSVLGEYGLSQMFSLGVKVAYQSENISESGSTNSTSYTGKGVTDPSIFLNGRTAAGPGNLRFGANLSISMGNDTVNSSNNENESSGGITFTPFVGYELGFGTSTVGARVAYDLLQTNRNVTLADSTTTKLENGNQLSAFVFYETNMAPVVWGVDLGVINHSATKFVTNGSTSNNHDSFTGFNIAAYGSWEVAQNVTILPTIGYGTPMTLMAPDPSGETGTGGVFGAVAARLGF